MRLKNSFIKALNKPVVNVGYCAAWYLLKDIERTGYNIGVNGWNYDVYVFEKLIICTGYRTSRTGGTFDTAITDKFNKQAETIFDNYNFTWSERGEQIKELRQTWLDELYKIYGGNNNA